MRGMREYGVLISFSMFFFFNEIQKEWSEAVKHSSSSPLPQHYYHCNTDLQSVFAVFTFPQSPILMLLAF